MRFHFIILLCCFSSLCFADYYISTGGSDSNPGTISQPFATLECARTNIRSLSHPLSSPVTVWIRGGRYYRQNAYVLNGSQDSGTPSSPVTYKNYGNESPILIGGMVATNFSSVVDAGILSRLTDSAKTNVLVANLTAQGIMDLGVMTNRGIYHADGDSPEKPYQSELLFNDHSMQIARWPNALTTYPRTNWSLIVAPNNSNSFGYTGNNPITWQEPTNAMVQGFWDYDYGDSWEMVSSIDTNNHIVTLVWPSAYGSQFNGHEYRADQRFFWFNILEELDIPGEYYIDRSTGKLYFWPPSTITDGSCIISTTTNIVLLSGVSNVVFSGITFEAGKFPLIQFSGGQSNLITQCQIHSGSASGVKMLQSSNSGVILSQFWDMGEMGVYFYGSGNRRTLTSGSNFVGFCTISNVSRLLSCAKSAVWISDSYSDPDTLNCIGVHVYNNLIHNVNGQAVQAYGNDHLIEYNEIYRVCLESADNGAVSSGNDPTFRGIVARYNYVHDVNLSGGASNFTGVHAFYWDGAICGTSTYGNLMVNVDHGVFLNGGRDNLVSNNIFVDITNYTVSKLVPFPVLANQSALGNGFTNMVGNTYWSRLTNMPYQGALWSNAYPTLATCTNGPYEAPNINICIASNNIIANNICWNCYTNADTTYGSYGLFFRWKDYGPPTPQSADETNSVVVNNLTNSDPLFVNYAARDFNLQSSSPAWSLGWVRIPLELIGPNPRYPVVGNVQTLRVGNMRMAQ